MSVNINLLPSELSVSKSLKDLMKTLRSLGVIAIAAFLVFAIGVSIFFVVSTITLNGVNANVTRLKSQVASLQTSEQQIILLKDRIAKITSVLGSPDSQSNLKLAASLLSSFPSDVSVTEMQIDPGAIDLTVSFGNNSDASSFVGTFENSDLFKSASLTSFSFSPASGYFVEVNAITK